MEKYPDFDWKQYIENYQDLRDTGIDTEEKALKHWINYGEKENRTYKFIIPTELLDFDWEQYIENYQDLKNAGINSREKALKHWINHGEKEGRSFLNLEIEKNLPNFFDINILKNILKNYEKYNNSNDLKKI